MKKNRTCACCKTQYHYCPNCGGPDYLKPSWYSEFCSEECKDIWDVATRYNMQLIDKQQAKKMLEKYDLSDRHKYVECIQRDLSKILVEESKTVLKADINQAPKTHEVVETKE